ncbi:cobalamin biosynthesis protein [Nocardia sp. 004]|uniref:cobalamin biosynthesis protein n=1 Tax=Nocardia sp. 004 TaxID=3385978 RepID=UPI0039A36DC2
MSRPELAVGIGVRPGTDQDRIHAAMREVFGADIEGVISCLATVDRRAAEPGLLAVAAVLRIPIRSYPARALADVRVPNPSARTANALGTASVAEAAAVSAGRGPLVIPKTTIHTVVLAAALAR